ALRALDWPDWLDLVLARVRDDDFPVRQARDLVLLAAESADRRVLPFLVATARGHRQRWVRATAVEILGSYRGPHEPAVFRLLVAALGEPSADVRAAAARALAAVGGDRARRQLVARADVEVDAGVV